MHLRRAALATTAALATALLSPAAAGASTTTSAAFDVTYSCVDSIYKSTTEVPARATVTATRTSADAVALAVSTGKLDFPVDQEFKDVRLNSTMTTTVDGVATAVSGSSTVTLRPGASADYPVARGTARTTATSLRFTPGALKVGIGFGLINVTLDCTVKGTAPTVTVPVVDPSAPAPAPAPVKPALKAGVTKKTQRVGKAPAKVVVSLARPSGVAVAPVGTVTVKVGTKNLSSRPVSDATSFRVALPKKLKPGSHRVTVTFAPASGTTAYARATATTQVRVVR